MSLFNRNKYDTDTIMCGECGEFFTCTKDDVCYNSYDAADDKYYYFVRCPKCGALRKVHEAAAERWFK